MINVTFWGTRGSVPVSGPRYHRYGGATTCLELTLEGSENPETPSRIVIDCGSGVAELGRHWGSRAGRTVVLFTHMHWDHIQGFPFFAPIFDAKNTLDLWSVSRGGQSVRETFNQHMSPPAFPVTLDMLPSTLQFAELPRQGHRQLGELSLSWREMTHPSGSSAFRFEHRDVVVVFSGDCEVREGCEASLSNFARNADLLIMDAQFSEEEYIARKGWGHSTVDDNIRVALDADVRRVIMTHHDPGHDDTRLDELLETGRRLARSSSRTLVVDSAFDGMQVSAKLSFRSSQECPAVM